MTPPWGVNFYLQKNINTETASCIIRNRKTTCVSDQPLFLRISSCSGVLVFFSMCIFKNLSSDTLISPIPPSTNKTSANRRKLNGWPDFMATKAIKKPIVLLPASPISRLLGDVLKYKEANNTAINRKH